MTTVFFWLSSAFVVYVYVGHPIFLWILSTFFGKPWRRAQNEVSVTVFVPAFNEAANIERKINLLLDQRYDGPYEVVIANDGSSDNTSSIVEKYDLNKTLRFFDFKENRGKAAVQNEVVPKLSSDIVVFTDATAHLPEGAISQIASHFADPMVGAVGVDISFSRGVHAGVAQGQRGYWRYERFLRTHGARFSTNISASGACYAIRRELFKGLPDDVSEDLANPLEVAFSGKRVVFDPDCVVEEVSTSNHDSEMRMRRRVAVRGITALVKYWRYLKPSAGFAAYQLLLHKYCRFFCWAAMIGALVSNLFLAGESALYASLLAAQVFFYGSAMVGFLLERKGKNSGLFRLPYYFCVLNFVYALAIWDYLRGVRRATWQTERA